MKYALVCALLALFAMTMVANGYRNDAKRWQRDYEAEVEIRSSLDEIMKEFRTACAER